MKRSLIVSTIIVLFISVFMATNVFALESQYQGFEVAGKIEIPSINVDLPILNTASKNSMKVSVALLNGNLNQVGNATITGHNNTEYTYFSNLKNLNNGDIIKITDMTDTVVTYAVYNKYETTSTDIDYISRDTNGKREITLSTATDDQTKRLIILARESDNTNNTGDNTIANNTVNNIVVVNNTINETTFNITNNTNNSTNDSIATTNTSSNTSNNVVVKNNIDDTVSKDKIPQTGEDTLVIGIIGIISIIGSISYIRFRKYKNLK